MATNKINTKAHIGGTNGGVALKYLGETISKDTNGIRTTQITYQSTKDKLLSAVNALSIGGYDDSISGYLTDINIKQDSGPFWNAVLTYSSSYSTGLTIHIGKSSSPTIFTCNTIMKSLALQTRDNYEYIWNHTLIYLDTDGFDQAAMQAKVGAISSWNSTNYLTLINSSSGHLKWIKDDSQRPTDPVYEDELDQNNQTVSVPHYWKIAYTMTKPGVEYYEFPTYEITQASRSTQQPDWWKDNYPGKVLAPSSMTNTMGISGGQWLCHGGQLRYDGKAYDASCTYQWTPDEWDKDLYDEAENNNNNGNPILP